MRSPESGSVRNAWRARTKENLSYGVGNPGLLDDSRLGSERDLESGKLSAYEVEGVRLARRTHGGGDAGGRERRSANEVKEALGLRESRTHRVPIQRQHL